MRASDGNGGCFPTGRHYPGISHLLRIVVAGIIRELASDAPLAELPLVSIDTETTGRDPERDRIVELALVFWRGGQVADQKSWLINPGCPIPRESFEVHGISDDDVRDKPGFAELAPEILRALSGCVPVAYNAEFDRNFLFAEFARLGALGAEPPPCMRREVVWIDPLVWAREVHKEEKSRALGDVCARLGIEIGQAHRATFDAEAALRVLLAFTSDPRVPRQYGAFLQEQRRLQRAQDELSRMWRSRAN